MVNYIGCVRSTLSAPVAVAVLKDGRVMRYGPGCLCGVVQEVVESLVHFGFKKGLLFFKF